MALALVAYKYRKSGFIGEYSDLDRMCPGDTEDTELIDFPERTLWAIKSEVDKFRIVGVSRTHTIEIGIFSNVQGQLLVHNLPQDS